MAFGYFPNGDGLLGIRAPNGTYRCQRLLFTDSGHYLLPIHNFNTKTDSKLDTLIMHESQLLARTSKTPQVPQQQKKTTNMTFPIALITEDSNDHQDAAFRNSSDDQTKENEMTAPPGLTLTTSPSPPFH